MTISRSTKSSGGSTSKARKASKAKATKTKASKTKAAKTKVSKTKAAKTKVSKTKTAKAKTSKAKAAKTKVPRAKRGDPSLAFEKAVRTASKEPPVPYKVSSQFGQGQRLQHKTFGEGVVSRVVRQHLVEVIFRDGTRRLAMNR
ncbi:MAG: hypothetical protein ACE5HD_08035 [Acidobacteriota bacterium]